jgi:AcrR family transcriptional regulator
MRLPGPERRQQLIHTAVEEFARNAYHSTSMNDVAEAAGVTKPVLYQHFTSKRDLYRQLLGEIGAQLRETIAKATSDATGPRQQIDGGLRAYFRFVAEHGDAYRVLFGSGTRRDEEFAEEAQRVEASIAEVVAGLIEVEGLDEDRRLLLANGMVGLVEGTSRYWLRHGIEVDPDTLAAEVSQLAWAGLRGIR